MEGFLVAAPLAAAAAAAGCSLPSPVGHTAEPAETIAAINFHLI